MQTQKFCMHKTTDMNLYRHICRQKEDIDNWGHTKKLVETIDKEKVLELVKETNIKIYVLWRSHEVLFRAEKSGYTPHTIP